MELIKIQTNENGEPKVSARDLYDSLEVKKSYRFNDWFKTNSKNLIPDVDFRGVDTTTQLNQYGGIQKIQDYSLTLDAAKQIAMMSNTAKGRKVRMYFIQVEKAFNSPEQIIARGVMFAQRQLESQLAYIQQLEPKALFADAVNASKTSILVGDLAKLLRQNGIEIGAKRLFDWLRENGYLIKRQGTDHNMPTQKSMELGLFEVKEGTYLNSDRETKITKTSKITGKGQAYFLKKFLSEVQVQPA